MTEITDEMLDDGLAKAEYFISEWLEHNEHYKEDGGIPDAVKRDIEEELGRSEVGSPVYYRSLSNVDLNAFRGVLQNQPYAELFADVDHATGTESSQ